MVNRFEQLPSSGDSENLNNDGASLHEGAPFVPKSEQLEKIVEEGPGSIKFGERPPISAGEKDGKELEEFIKKTQSEILLNILAGGNERIGVEDIRRHDTEFAPKKMAEIENDAQRWVENMPANLEKLSKDQNGYNAYAEFLKSNGRQKEIIPEKEFSEMIEKIKAALERKDLNTERLLKEHYEHQRLGSIIGVPTELEKHEPVENPYKEIERRLNLAQEELKKQGLDEDAENLGRTIARIQKETVDGKDPINHEILLWDKISDSRSPEEPTTLDKLAKKVDSWMLKIPLIGRYMSRDYRESVRPAGGVIIRADGSQEEFYTFSRFKKSAEKTHTNDLGGNDYDYRAELQPGDEVVSWEPSERGKNIIMEVLGGSNISTPNKFASSLGESNIEYWSSEFNTSNVEFKVRRGEDLENRQLYSIARLSIFPPPSPPYKKI